MLLRELREQVIEAGLEANRRGIVHGTAGNFSIRDHESGLIAISPTGMPYGAMTAADVVLVDTACRVHDGHRKPSSETPMHTMIMAAHPDLVAAGLHCVPAGGDKQAIIASTLDVIGKPSDPEDILHGATTIAPSHKAPKLGIMLPLLDHAGKEIGSLALQFKYQSGEDQVKYLAEATAIRDHVAQRIPALGDLFNPAP